MITCNKNVANAVGGKTARACDSCIKNRARWYCAADDAFLCQSCDSSVHSANSLARRHERVRLKTASLNSFDIEPSWHRGFTRKPRTPRPARILSDNNKSKHHIQSIPFVPELVASNEDTEQEQQLLYRVPIFDPFAAELCSSTTNVSNEAETAVHTPANGVESRECVGGSSSGRLHGFVTSDMDLSDFAEDVESLLGRGLENECFRMEELGLADCKEEKEEEEEEEELHCLKRGKMKLEDEEKNEKQQRQQRKLEFDTEIDMVKESPFQLSFEYDSATCGEEEEKVEPKFKNNNNINGEHEDKSKKKTKKNNKKKRKIVLSLDYDAVISAWANQGCPWTNGNRPEVDLDDECWPDWIMGNWGGEVEQQGYGGGRGGQYGVMAGGGRAARVTRYREKRRTRLFTKKIRYEVRKLNAEKRPRMKGRFVKRATFGAAH